MEILKQYLPSDILEYILTPYLIEDIYIMIKHMKLYNEVMKQFNAIVFHSSISIRFVHKKRKSIINPSWYILHFRSKRKIRKREKYKHK